MDSGDLSAFLEAFRSEGEFDSEGSFTLDRQRAVGKLARHLLADDGSWILRFVQAASRLEAGELRVKEVRAYSSLRLRTARRLAPREVRQGLLSASLGDGGVNALCQSVRAAARDGRLVTLTLHDRSSCTNFLIHKDQVHQSDSQSLLPEQAGSVVSLLVQRRAGAEQGLFERGKDALHFAEAFLEGVDSNEYRMLMNRARVSTVPLWLNGQRIDDLNIPWNLKQGTRTHYVGAVFAHGRSASDDRIPVPRGISRSDRAGTGGFLPSNHGPLASMTFLPSQKVNCLLGVHHYTQRSYEGTITSRMHYARDGVLVDSVTSHFYSTVGFDLVLSPAGLHTDAGGLKAEIPTAVVDKYGLYLGRLRGPLKKLALYLTGPSYLTRDYHAPREFEGLDFASKLRMFAAGRLKIRRDAGLALEWALSRPPFDIPEVGLGT